MTNVASLSSFNEIWQRTSLVQRVLLAGIALACAAVAVYLINWARQPKYALLYGGLAPQEAAKIVEKVEDEGVAYETKDGGTSVYVESGKVRELRMKLAAQSLPSGGHSGYKILEDQRIGTSPYMQKVNHIRAVEGELAMTLEVLDAVVKARVKIAQAKDGVFKSKDRKPASASVMLRLRPGTMLTSGNVVAVVNVIAGGVEGLTPANVTVADADGNLLSDEGGTEVNKAARTILEQKFQVEDRLARRITNHLLTVLGPGRASVMVSAKVDTTRKTETVETLGTPVEVSSTSKIKTVPAAGGTGGAAAAPGKDTTTESKSEAGKTISVTETQPGQIKNVSVSCFVDLSPPKVAEGEEAPAPHKLTEDNVKTAIRTALGMDATLIDSLVVVDTPFTRGPAVAAAGTTDEEAGMFTPEFMLEMGRSVSLGLLVIGVLLGLKIVRKAKKVAAGPLPLVEGEMPQGDKLLAAAVVAESDPDVLKTQITNALQENPDEVKRLFMSWVDSGQGDR